MNGPGRVAVHAHLAPSDTALVTQGRVLLREGDIMNGGTTFSRLPLFDPAINDRGAFAVTGYTGVLADYIVAVRNDIVLQKDLELPDGAVIAAGSPPVRPVMDSRNVVSVRTNVEHEGRVSNIAGALVTPKGVAVMQADLLPDGRPIDDIEAPAANGRGEIAFVAVIGGQQAVLLGKPTRGCRNLLDRDVPVPDGYGAAYEISGTKLVVRVRCGFSRAILQVGSGGSDQRVNPEAFLWEDGEWRPIELKGEERTADGWFIGAASANLRLSGRQMSQEQQVLAQICTEVSFGSLLERKCGCRDSQCQETFWQLQRFQRQR